MYLRSTCSDRNYAKQRYAARENKRRTEPSVGAGNALKGKTRARRKEKMGEGESERRAGGGEGERGAKKERGKINGWRKSVSCELRVASCRASRTLVAQRVPLWPSDPCIDTPNESVCKEGCEGWAQRDEEFSRRPPASKSCLCMTMLRLADDPH